MEKEEQLEQPSEERKEKEVEGPMEEGSGWQRDHFGLQTVGDRSGAEPDDYSMYGNRVACFDC